MILSYMHVGELCVIACLLCCLLMSFVLVVLWLKICVEVVVEEIPQIRVLSIPPPFFPPQRVFFRLYPELSV